jgi:transcriptional regulator with XRE-family HTH domain
MNVVAASFGANLARARERTGITQEELSFRASCTAPRSAFWSAAVASPASTPSPSSQALWECQRPACSTASTGSRASSRAVASGSGLQMRPAHDDDLSQP